MLVLDTHVWVWYVMGSNKLAARTVATMDEAVGSDRFMVPAISIWEVAMLAERRRLTLDRSVDDWVRGALDAGSFRLAELTPAIAVRAARLPTRTLTDPSDRMIVATALEWGAPLATRDAKILAFAETSALETMAV